MHGLMMHRPLNIADILTYGAQSHPTGEIVSARVEGDLHRQTYVETARRTAQLAHALRAMGIETGDRVATLAWNGHRHLELYYAVSGIGAVCHTINPRLSAEQMLYILEHAGDRVLFLDATFAPILAKLGPQLPAGLRLVVMTDRAHMPEGLEAECYEDLLAAQSPEIDWPELDEDAAAGLCYTSGTTGRPKGALYSHRSTVLHAMIVAISLSENLRPGRKVLPVVPLFHVNAWGLPYCAPLVGCSLVMPGPRLDGASLWELMDAEEVYSAWGVPTVWLGLLGEIRKRGALPKGFKDVVIGGSAAPRSMIEAFEDAGVNVCHAWGMTEMSPIGTHGNLPSALDHLPREDRMRLKATQGRRAFGIDLKIVDEDGRRLPHDGEASGELYVRANTTISAYYEDAEATREAFDAEGWFGTGDIAKIDPDGFLTLTDRAKDLIKSGGEWISSIDLENVVMSHPGVANCAVIAVPHPKWEERPLLIVVPAEGAARPERDELMALLEEHFAKWQLPDDVVYTDALPLTATGKVSKLTLRQTYGDHVLPGVASEAASA
jgi:fatty-acyl-CoA synthase